MACAQPTKRFSRRSCWYRGGWVVADSRVESESAVTGSRFSLVLSRWACQTSLPRPVASGASCVSCPMLPVKASGYAPTPNREPQSMGGTRRIVAAQQHTNAHHRPPIRPRPLPRMLLALDSVHFFQTEEPPRHLHPRLVAHLSHPQRGLIRIRTHEIEVEIHRSRPGKRHRLSGHGKSMPRPRGRIPR